MNSHKTTMNSQGIINVFPWDPNEILVKSVSTSPDRHAGHRQVKDPLAQMRERLEAQRAAAPKYQARRCCDPALVNDYPLEKTYLI